MIYVLVHGVVLHDLGAGKRLSRDSERASNKSV